MKDVIRLLTLFAALLLIVPAAGADWSENFDSYAAGSGLHGQGGWEVWGGNLDYDAFITDSYSRSAPNSVAIVDTTDIVQLFTETTGEWEMTAWCYIPTSSTGNTYFIMLNRYPTSPSWSVQITFDTDAGTLSTQGGSTAAIVFDQWVEVKVEIYLDANSKNLYYNSGFLESNIWQSGGVDEIAALDLFSTTIGSIAYWDDCNLINTGGALEQTTWGNIKTITQ
ncbi:MAG: hypothetical protein K8S15_14900 [Candidatus Aegiribacteria sp.]|nr:hypothetical protein [Candidatus Aegiribacteria sp.]